MVVNLSWRWIYYVTAIGGGFFLTGTFFFLPETRWNRTRSEMNGIPRDDAGVEYTPRTWSYDLMPFHGPVNMTKGLFALLDTLRTFFYPQILFITLLNSAMISTAFSASYTTAPALLTKPWSWRFQNLGLCLVPVLISAIICGAVTGAVADKFANWCAKKRGSREPENQLVNLILPTILGLCGAVMFGIAGNNPSKYHWIILLVGLGFMAFGFLGANSVGAVYVLECYPHLAGPALVNIAAFRCIFAFCKSPCSSLLTICSMLTRRRSYLLRCRLDHSDGLSQHLLDLCRSHCRSVVGPTSSVHFRSSMAPKMASN